MPGRRRAILALTEWLEGDQGVDDDWADVTVATRCFEMLTRLRLFEKVQNMYEQ